MTIISLTDACQRLGIDAKTLRRWLIQAELPLVPDAQDARKKGVAIGHLHQLALLHHRRLLPDASEPDPAEVQTSLPAAVLALPEQLSVLHQQIEAVQQQVADLHRLLHQQAMVSAPSATPHPPVSSVAHVPRQTTSSPAAQQGKHPSRAAQPPRHVIARMEYAGEGRYVIMCPKKGRLLIEPETAEWWAWLGEQDSFRFVGQAGHFTAHHEWRVPKGAWRAHRNIRGRSHTLRLAPTGELTVAMLEQAAEEMQARAQ